MKALSGNFFTGFPGFICQELVRELLATKKDISDVFLLVLPTQKSISLPVIQSYQRMYPQTAFHLIEGDITQPDLIMIDDDQQRVRERTHYVFHLAAIYDLAVKKEIAFEVNVNGTREVLRWLKSVPGLKRFMYFSTAYVAGRRDGKMRCTVRRASPT
jgi:nucleoside-diphosphate-sugar epimerase